MARARVTPAPALANSRWHELNAAQRNERSHSVFVAIDRLIAWIKTERHEFMTRLLGVAPPPRKKKKAQSPGLTHVPEVVPPREATGQEEAQEKEDTEEEAEVEQEEVAELEQEEDKRRKGKPER